MSGLVNRIRVPVFHVKMVVHVSKVISVTAVIALWAVKEKTVLVVGFQKKNFGYLFYFSNFDMLPK